MRVRLEYSISEPIERSISMIKMNQIRSLLPSFVVLVFLLLSDSAMSQPQTPILGGAKERQPGYGEMENFTILSYSDLDGWDQAAEFRVSKDGKYAYVSNYQGFSIVDVSDPAKPRVISKVKNDPDRKR